MIIVGPAYGRKYSDVDQILADWKANKDFRIEGNGPYMNKSDWKKYGNPLDYVSYMHGPHCVILEQGVLL